MRIISGKFKGQTIHFIKNKITRPLNSVKKIYLIAHPPKKLILILKTHQFWIYIQVDLWIRVHFKRCQKVIFF